MKVVVSFDGACRRNGKPNAIGAAGLHLEFFNNENPNLLESHSSSSYAIVGGATNQSAEIQGFIMALEELDEVRHVVPLDDVYLVTDSEYVFNTITKQWYKAWQNSGWINASGDPVKNKALWEKAIALYEKLEGFIQMYHIKGHAIKIGRIGIETLVAEDTDYSAYREALWHIFDRDLVVQEPKMMEALALSERNNGYMLPPEAFKKFVVGNMVADTIATRRIEEELDNERAAKR
jgi:ribonuclease HI